MSHNRGKFWAKKGQSLSRSLPRSYLETMSFLSLSESVGVRSEGLTILLIRRLASLI